MHQIHQVVSIPKLPVAQEVDEDEDRRFHVIITAEGSATHWQCRLHYYWCDANDNQTLHLADCRSLAFCIKWQWKLSRSAGTLSNAASCAWSTQVHKDQGSLRGARQLPDGETDPAAACCLPLQRKQSSMSAEPNLCCTRHAVNSGDVPSKKQVCCSSSPLPHVDG